ncbi:PepSY domain-containing protein [Roseibaca sp. Y0-43]|uniref:PepSY domain-containing protein n=1 Tax=Roseibaca sp. Y0-43 TaxID=2816854 RepID=UPI001D0C2238|nr:PepSY domain-containing protein [Roseibaca sp. Y0-43]MCC1482400.1 PepSY domain-containing protein [Roseibaca sp. Y0-43]
MKRLAITLLLSLAAAAAPALADRDDHDRARRALDAGEILPLSDILAAVHAVQPGRVIEIELERDDGRWVYELELVSPEGQLYDIEIDAATAMVLEVERDGDDD